MKTLLILFCIVSFAACTAYKSGQTTDDIYFSKGKTIVKNIDSYERLDHVYEDRQIRMSAYDYRWRTINDNYDYNYRYSPYDYGYNYGYYYNPYYYAYPVYNGNLNFVNPKNTSIRSTNLSTYNNTISTYTQTKGSGNVKTISVRGYNNNNSQTIRNTNNDYRTNNNNRDYNPSSSNNNNSNNNNNSSAPASTGGSVTRPSRGQ